MVEEKTVSLGVSACLLGKRVRYDGGHKHESYITDTLGKYIQLAGICPEEEAGFGIPRETVDLHGLPESLRIIGNETGRDITARMKKYIRDRIHKSDIAEMCGFILKSKSPSCGMGRVKLIGPNGRVKRSGTGLFAQALMKQYPFLPVIDEKKLNNPKIRECFIVRVFAYHRLKHQLFKRFSHRSWSEFHARERHLIESHSLKHRRLLDRLVTDIANYNAANFRAQYSSVFMESLTFHATKVKNIKVLTQLAASLRRFVKYSELQKITKAISSYRDDKIQLGAVLSLLLHTIDQYQITELQEQTYLHPHPLQTNIY